MFFQLVGKLRIMYLELLAAVVLPGRESLFRNEAKKAGDGWRKRDRDLELLDPIMSDILFTTSDFRVYQTIYS